jgi:hypothetical protein
LLAAKAAGYSHVNIDGTLVETGRCATPGPVQGTVSLDPWRIGKIVAAALVILHGRKPTGAEAKKPPPSSWRHTGCVGEVVRDS